jgi:hypothetical protein
MASGLFFKKSCYFWNIYELTRRPLLGAALSFFRPGRHKGEEA